jgi:hypothetical protein
MAEVNAGLGNLTELKAFILAASMRAQTDYDEQLLQIGKFVAGIFSERCTRKFEYSEGNVDEMTANRSFMLATHYPLNLTEPLKVEICDGWVNGAPVWTEITNAIYNVGADASMVQLAGYQGNYLSRIRLTSTGGYWWLGLDALTAAPAGATEIPGELKAAWLVQCQALWLVRDNLGITVAGAGSVSFVTLSLPGFELIPEVRDLLVDYKRYSMSG